MNYINWVNEKILTWEEVQATNLSMVRDPNGGDWAFMLDPLVWFCVLESIQDCETSKKRELIKKIRVK